MKILFICGSLEQGKDGVGDYSRRLAAELIRQGHECRLMALRDRYVTDYRIEIQESELTEITALRCPGSAGFTTNSREAKKWSDKFNPEWVSFQYVPFSYHDKGLPLGLGFMLNSLLNGRKLHVMIHELWVGMEKHSTPKHVIWGYFQQLVLIFNLKFIKTDKIHTQSGFYQQMLYTINKKADLLPLFSNIRVQYNNHLTEDKDVVIQNSDLNFLLFGTIHPSGFLNEFLVYVKEYAFRHSKKVTINVVGRTGIVVNKWKHSCEKMGLSILIHGEKPPEFIEQLLSSGMIGISTTALPMIQKSGTVASMRESGMPVICISHLWTARIMNYKTIPEGVFSFDKNVIDSCLSFERTASGFPGLQAIASQFAKDLTNT